MALLKQPNIARLLERFSFPVAVALWSMAAFIVVVVAYICLVLLGYADIRPLLLVITAFH